MYLDKISDNLISAVKPSDTEDSYKKRFLKGEILESKGGAFSLTYKRKKFSNGIGVFFGLRSLYRSPVGEIEFGIVPDLNYLFIREESFEKFFPKKSEIDNFLKRWNEKTEGRLSEIVENSKKNNETRKFSIILWHNAPQYEFIVDSEIGKVYYFEDSLEGELKILNVDDNL